MCCCISGSAPPVSSPPAHSHPTGMLAGATVPSGGVLDSVSGVPGPLEYVWGCRGGVRVKTPPSLDYPRLAILSSLRWSWGRVEGWGKSSGNIISRSGARGCVHAKGRWHVGQRELWGLLALLNPPQTPIIHRSFNDPIIFPSVFAESLYARPWEYSSTQDRPREHLVKVICGLGRPLEGPGERPEEAGVPF